MIAHPTGLPVEEPWSRISNRAPNLDRLELREALLLRAALPGSEIRGVPAGEQRSAGIAADRPGCTADGGGRRGDSIDGWAADPTSGAGALHPQSQGQEKAGEGLVLND